MSAKEYIRIQRSVKFDEAQTYHVIFMSIPDS